MQRSAETVPGLGGRVRIEVGDVTGGQALVRITDPVAHADLAPQRSMRIGDDMPFTLDGQPYNAALLRLVNLLIGDDFAEFGVGVPGTLAGEQIEAMLRHIADSGLVFVRDGVDYDGKAAADHLRRKWQAMAADVTTRNEFVTRVASGSSTTGDEYQVRLPGGRIIPLVDWLCTF